MTVKFTTSFAYHLSEVVKDGVVVKFNVAYNGALASIENRLKKDYNRWQKAAKDLGKYLSNYRNISPQVFKDSYYDSQITVLEGLKARKARAAKLLKRIKYLKNCGYRTANAVANEINNDKKYLNYNKTDVSKYEYTNKVFKDTLENLVLERA